MKALKIKIPKNDEKPWIEVMEDIAKSLRRVGEIELSNRVKQLNNEIANAYKARLKLAIKKLGDVEIELIRERK